MSHGAGMGRKGMSQRWVWRGLSCGSGSGWIGQSQRLGGRSGLMGRKGGGRFRGGASQGYGRGRHGMSPRSVREDSGRIVAVGRGMSRWRGTGRRGRACRVGGAGHGKSRWVGLVRLVEGAARRIGQVWARLVALVGPGMASRTGWDRHGVSQRCGRVMSPPRSFVIRKSSRSE